MNEFTSKIEALEHLWMRAWRQRDRKLMKSLTSKTFIFLLGSTKAAILDRASWLEGTTTRFRLKDYQFGEVYIRRHGSVAIFVTQLTLNATIDDVEWTGQTWMIDLWRKSRIKRKWRLVERTISRPDTDKAISKAIHSMQLWR